VRRGQGGELGREEPGEVQPGQGQGPAPGEEQPQAPVQAGVDLLESSSVERDLSPLSAFSRLNKPSSLSLSS